MQVRSLSTRLLASVSVLLVIFFGLTIIALDLVFRDISERAIMDRLEVQVFALLSVSEESMRGGLEPAPQLAESRYNSPGSGLYGEIRRTDDATTWRSNSMVGTGLDFGGVLSPGQRRFGVLPLTNGSEVLALSLGIAWEFPNGSTRNFVYSVAENLDPYYAQLNRLRGQMFGWFIGLMLLLLAALAFVFRSVLSPVRRVAREIEEIEIGQLSELGSGYPRELVGVTTNMNALLRSERERLARYRNTLGNLAHSLKTPLAVMRNLLGSETLRDAPVARQLDEQVSRMDDIVRYQLKRAAASGGTGLGQAPVDVQQTLESLRGALVKVYADRGLDLRLQVEPGCRFIGDQGDLTEIAGNLLDNACKWAHRTVSLSAAPLLRPGARHAGLLLVIEDDGPGIAPDARARVLERGARLDERVSGQGIGLSVVRELAEVSGGSVAIDDSPLGGARVEVQLPAP
jgi:two-component system sensor histidine kinase PhoQ